MLGLSRRPYLISVFDPQNKLAAVLTRKTPIK